jgi:hypothetical protein
MDAVDASLWACIPSNNKPLHWTFTIPSSNGTVPLLETPLDANLWTSTQAPQHGAVQLTSSQQGPQASKDPNLGNLNALHLDLDGYNIALDNCTTGHITFNKDDFIANLYTEYSDVTAIKRVGGTTAAAGRGSVKWMLMDKKDELHMFVLHNVNYAPTSPL